MKKLFLPALLFISISASAQWTALYSGTTNTLRGVHFITDSLGWVCGESLNGVAPILKTTDAGNTWQLTNHITPNALRAIYFVDADTGIIVGFGGTILRTTDGGTTWDSIISPTVQPLRSLCFTAHDTGYACGGFGTVMKTTDAGATWTIQTTPITTDLINIRFANANTGFAVSSNSTFLDGHILKTTDGGANWTDVYADPNTGYLGIAVVDANTIYAGGYNQYIIKSIDGGTNWSPVFTGTAAFLFRGASFNSASEGWFVGGTNGDIWYTNDGGTSWANEDTLLGYEFLGINFPNPQLGYTVGTLGTILKFELPCATLNNIPEVVGPSSVCAGDTAAFLIGSVDNANAYAWSVPTGATLSQVNDTAVIVIFGTQSGNVTVTAYDDCDTVSASVLVTVNPLPATPVIAWDGTNLSSSAATGNQWYLNGYIISGATNQTYTPVISGIYSVLVTTAAGCTALSADYNLNGVGIETIKQSAFKIFPNPMNDATTISFEGMNADEILITDLAGKLIQSLSTDNRDKIILPRNEIAAGTFIIQLMQGGRILERKILIAQ